MSTVPYPNFNPQKALIWRIIHRNNIPWTLDNGLHCGNSDSQCSSWINIGNSELIAKRANHPVPRAPGGFLNDYVPFYFTPFSPMLGNIRLGRGGVQQRPNEEIVILVASLHRIASLGFPFLFTDGHAYYQWTNYYSDLIDLDKVDWTLLQMRDFKRDPDNPAKFERYQAEALIHRHLPILAISGIVCYADSVKQEIEQQLDSRGLKLDVIVRQGLYFR